MILFVHIITASFSVIYRAYVFFRPSRQRLNISLTLVLAAVASGTYLIFIKPDSLTQTCITGLAYLAFVTAGIISAKYKLALAISK